MNTVDFHIGPSHHYASHHAWLAANVDDWLDCFHCHSRYPLSSRYEPLGVCSSNATEVESCRTYTWWLRVMIHVGLYCIHLRLSGKCRLTCSGHGLPRYPGPCHTSTACIQEMFLISYVVDYYLISMSCSNSSFYLPRCSDNSTNQY